MTSAQVRCLPLDDIGNRSIHHRQAKIAQHIMVLYGHVTIVDEYTYCQHIVPDYIFAVIKATVPSW